MSDRRCKTCKDWDSERKECHHYSPKAQASGEKASWPLTDAEDWCGEWKPVEKSMWEGRDLT